MIVLDASAALDMLLRTTAAARIEKRVFSAGQTLHAPHLIDIEIAQALRRIAHQGGDAGACRLALMTWLAIPVRRHDHAQEGIVRAWELRTNFTAYDAAYIALAEALGAPLLTRDRKLLAGGHTAKVELV